MVKRSDDTGGHRSAMPSKVSTDLTSCDTNREYKEKRGYERPERVFKK
jgi:hypothetical protein